MIKDKKLIVVSNETKERLGEFGRKSDTYNDIVIRLLDNSEQNKLKGENS